MSRRQTLWDHLRWDLLALIVIGALTLGYAMLQQPRIQPAELALTDGSKPPDRSEGDILLVLPMAPAAQATNFATMDCTFSWFNALWQHFGTFATAPMDHITPQLLAGHAVVILPSRVASEIPSNTREHLADFARQGGQLIVEAPRQIWEPITGLSTVGTIGRAESVTSAEGLGIDGPLRDHLLEVPLTGRILPTDELELRPSGPVILEVEGQPGLVVEPLGDGHVYSLLFDFACSLLAMNQGKPTREMEFGPPDAEPWLPTDQRVAYEALLSSHIPYATVLQRALFDRLPEARPMARLWPFPGHYSGAAMTIHTAHEDPRAAFGYADRARKQEASSTIFAAPDYFTSDHTALTETVNADVGLLWVLGQTRPPITEGVGVGAIEPRSRELSLARQHAKLESAFGGPSSISQVRTEANLWKTDWDTTFRNLAAAGLRIDSSFGPSDPAHFGYLFGSGMPFFPLDDRGRPLPVMEVPFAFDGASISSPRLRQLLEASRDGFHQPVVVSLAADAMKRHPSVGIMLGFRDFHQLARETEHWLTTIGDYTDFLTARRHSVITSQWSPEQSRLTISVNLMGARLSSAPKGAIPSVAIPDQYQGRAIERIEVDDDTIAVDLSTRSGFGDERLLELPPGRHVVSVFYEPPGEAPGDDPEDPR